MNREIKFRAWDILKKKFVDSYNNTVIAIDFSGDVIKCNTESCENPFSYYGNTEIVLMQYTGLKDKNGKEIFEGDSDGVEKIEYCSDYGGFVMYNKHTQRYRNLTCDTAMFFSVIGNIFENPELLNN